MGLWKCPGPSPMVLSAQQYYSPPPQMWLTTLNPRSGLESKFPKGQKLQISWFHPVWSFPLPRFSTQEDTFIHTSVAWRHPLKCLRTQLTLVYTCLCKSQSARELCVWVWVCVSNFKSNALSSLYIKKHKNNKNFKPECSLIGRQSNEVIHSYLNTSYTCENS